MKKDFSEKIISSCSKELPALYSLLSKLNPSCSKLDLESFLNNFFNYNLKNLYSDKFPFLRSKNKKLEKIVVNSEILLLKDLLIDSLVTCKIIETSKLDADGYQTIDQLTESVYLLLKKHNNL